MLQLRLILRAKGPISKSHILDNFIYINDKIKEIKDKLVVAGARDGVW